VRLFRHEFPFRVSCTVVIGRSQVWMVIGSSSSRISTIRRGNTWAESDASTGNRMNRASMAVMVGTAFTAVRSQDTLPRIRVFVVLPGVSKMLWGGPLDSPVQLKGVVVTSTTSGIISLICRWIVDRKNGPRAFILDPWRERTMGKLVCQAGVVLSVREVRNRYTEDGSNGHILPMIFQQQRGVINRSDSHKVFYVRR
jgi:hypothetical protein